MKKQFFVAFLGAALALPIAVQAQSWRGAEANGTHIGANIGRSEMKLTVDGFGSATETETGYRLYVGHQVNTNFGLEAGYANLGKVGTATSYTETEAVYVAATGTLPLDQKLALFAKVGVSANSTKLRDSWYSETEDETTAIVGIGASYRLDRNLSLVAEYKDFGKVIDVSGVNLKANLFSIGLRYKF